VVFLAGAGTAGMDYYNLQARAAELSTSVLYDRGGTGWSDRVKLPRSSSEVIEELRQLLEAAGLAPPYVVVGHSLGGLYARHYATRFPADTAGLVLLDPGHEDYDAYMPEELRQTRTGWPAFVTKQVYRLVGAAAQSAGGRKVLARVPAVRRYQELYRSLFAKEMADWPAEIRDPLIERHVSVEWLTVGLRETQNVDDLYREVRAAGPLPDVPLVILCSTEIDDFRRAVAPGESESLLHQEFDGKRRLYEALAASVPRGQCRLVSGGHVTVLFRAADAVITAIRDVMEIARNDG
jgi:pimeloyl-ACP methyl ester carboxylesterase